MIPGHENFAAADVISAHKVFPLTPDMGRRRVSVGDYLRSLIFLSENLESASGLVWGYGVLQSLEDFLDSFVGRKPDRG